MADLRTLRQRVEEKRRLEKDAQRIAENIRTMEALLPQLVSEVERQESDVTRMENGGGAGILYSVLGKQEEKLEKERREAWEAQVKYQDALTTLRDLHKQQEDVSASLAQYGDIETEYRSRFSRQRQSILASQSAAGQRLRALEEDARQLKGLRREAREAQDAGEQVMAQVEKIEGILRSASGWGVVDLISDSFISDMAKYGKMDQAQRELGELRRLLNIYARELKDLDVRLNVSADLGTGMRVADFLFDNIFTDSIAMSRIENVKAQMRQIRSQVQRHRDLVNRKLESADAVLAEKRSQAEQIILDG